MPELATILEREGRTVDLKPGHYDRLLRRHDRRHRNRRIGSALLAVAITAATIGYAINVIRGRAERVPMDRITSRNIEHLAVSWTAGVGVQDGWQPIIRDGVVYAGVGDAAQGFPLDCSATDGSCAPNWSTALSDVAPIQGVIVPMVVGDTSVYASEGASHPTIDSQWYRIDAFPRACGSGPCRPTWTSPKGDVRMYPVEEVDGIVYVARGNMLLAFAGSCGQAVCDPIWSARGVGAPTIAEGQALVRTRAGVRAYASACWDRRGPSCRPIWTGRTQSPSRGTGTVAGQPQALGTGSELPPTPNVAEGHVIVSDDRSVYSFASGCRGACHPEWIGHVPGGPGFSPVVAGGMVLEAAQGGSDLYAFPLNCPGGGPTCRPTWTGHTDEGVGFQPLIADRYIVVAGVLGSSLIAFPTACAGACSPAWVAPLDDSIDQAPSATEDLVFVSGLNGVSAFKVACWAPCSPIYRWESAVGSPQTAPVAIGDAMTVVAGDALHVFRLEIGRSAIESSPDRDRALPLVLIGLGLFSMVVIGMVRRRRPTLP